jgi:hypothetical protein
VILPFAYTQALFADGRYDKAADMLREALKNVTPEKEGVFFPRGLYANDDALFAQVEKLVDKVDSTENDADLQLLLGYQLLGVGETGYAREQLEQASRDPKAAVAAGILLNVVEKMEKEAGPAATKAGSGTIKMPASKTDKSTVAPTLPAESTPLVPAETAPAIPPEEKPDLQKKEPSNAGKESTGPVDESTVGPTQGMEQPAENNDNGGGAGAVQEGNPGAAAEKAGFLGSTATASVLPGWSGLMGRHAPNCKVDIAIFASILSLALAGVWIEWRLPGRQSV